MKTIQYSVDPVITTAITEELNTWQKQDKVRRLWESDASLWTNKNEAQWTGWLNIATKLDEVPVIEALAQALKTAQFSHVVVLGMGGSSLFPALIAQTFGKIDNHPRLHVLDSTDPQQIRHLEDSLDLEKTLFIVSSKSGTTLESNNFKQYFYGRLQSVLKRTEVGDRFLAITDPGTSLATLAHNEKFKAIFYGIPSIGGRYSALSNFGIVPLGLMGIDIKQFLQHAITMAESCTATILPSDNPGVLLGILLGVCAKYGKDKVTLVVSPAIHALGAWLEQLLAESTGKNGKGLIPVDQEPLGLPENYGNDRVIVYIRLENANDAAQDHAIAILEQSGQVIIRLQLADKNHLGAQILQWEIATAVASSILGVNPFDQPDVEASKVRALQLTAEYEITRNIFQPKPIFAAQGMQLFTDDSNAREIQQCMHAEPSLVEYLRAHFSRTKQGDYVNFSAFIAMSDENTALLQACRALIRDRKKIATCLGFGPRFLHSTGQAYKGGPNTGVFLQITADHGSDIQVPNHSYTFGLVIAAQAQADFEVLTQQSRRALRIHLGHDVQTGLQDLYQFLKLAL